MPGGSSPRPPSHLLSDLLMSGDVASGAEVAPASDEGRLSSTTSSVSYRSVLYRQYSVALVALGALERGGRRTGRCAGFDQAWVWRHVAEVSEHHGHGNSTLLAVPRVRAPPYPRRPMHAAFLRRARQGPIRRLTNPHLVRPVGRRPEDRGRILAVRLRAFPWTALVMDRRPSPFATRCSWTCSSHGRLGSGRQLTPPTSPGAWRRFSPGPAASPRLPSRSTWAEVARGARRPRSRAWRWSRSCRSL